MIVRNEETALPACLSCLKNLVDEMIIVDTGSTDDTMAIARSFGARVFEFKWIDDFAAARNYAFSKATCDYIYSADADETLDEPNIEKFKTLKKALSPVSGNSSDNDDLPVDIVQMYYCGQLSGNERTVYNYDRELRPKLFRRVRTFFWEGNVHEQIRTDPVIFDSDIEINHHPGDSHSSRDLRLFEKAIASGQKLSTRLLDFYARELYMAGTPSDFEKARFFFISVTESPDRSIEDIQKASIILARDAGLSGNIIQLMKFALKDATIGCSSETCCELGDWYLSRGDISEAILWYYNAAFEQSPVLDIHSGGDRPLRGLAECYLQLGNEEESEIYRDMADKWTIPQTP
jgi:glycosyltransferase involved in cell wall biosynthesis